MSKASEWAKAPTFPRHDLQVEYKDAEGYVVLWPRGTVSLVVNQKGSDCIRFTPTEALAFAKWITDTFGDPPTPGGA